MKAKTINASTLRKIRWTPYILRYILPLIFLLAGTVYIVKRVSNHSISHNYYTDMERLSPEEGLKLMSYKGRYTTAFNDLNDEQLVVAQSIGIEPMQSREDLDSRLNDLVEVKETQDYALATLSHSVPYLVPKAKKLLDEIGKRFSEKLYLYGQKPYRLQVTSITRTLADVRGLSKNNVNSTPNSTHLYGTTIDISWATFVEPPLNYKAKNGEKDLSPEQLKGVLAQVLHELKEAGRCFVKHERKQPCFHITVR
ncbi:MAG: DUF5715 family protein [Porphyromonas sp.]|nr:DUF5715 family protein [Porphyromonas sp.]